MYYILIRFFLLYLSTPWSELIKVPKCGPQKVMTTQKTSRNCSVHWSVIQVVLVSFKRLQLTAFFKNGFPSMPSVTVHSFSSFNVGIAVSLFSVNWQHSRLRTNFYPNHPFAYSIIPEKFLPKNVLWKTKLKEESKDG